MIRILNLGKEKREKIYLKTTCPWCDTELVFELKDVWIDDPIMSVGRVECPVPGCRSKVHMKLPEYPIMEAETVDKEVYYTAHSDTSKSGLRILMDEKKELENDRDECYASFYNEKEAITNENNNR